MARNGALFCISPIRVAFGWSGVSGKQKPPGQKHKKTQLLSRAQKHGSSFGSIPRSTHPFSELFCTLLCAAGWPLYARAGRNELLSVGWLWGTWACSAVELGMRMRRGFLEEQELGLRKHNQRKTLTSLFSTSALVPVPTVHSHGRHRQSILLPPPLLYS